MYSFEFEQPADLASATHALSEDGAQALAGGQTLIPTLKARLASPSRLVSLNGIDDLQGVSTDSEGSVVVGATTTHAEVAAATAGTYPALSWLAGNIGDPAVRNRGTIGGSIANNDPSACYPAAALASGATIVTNRRSVAADDFFLDIFETALGEGEIITSVKFPVPETANYQKFEQPASRFALVGVFVARGAGGVRVAVTGASQMGVYRWQDAEQALAGRFAAEALDGIDMPDGDMISDVHGSATYRAHLVKVLTGRAVAAAS